MDLVLRGGKVIDGTGAPATSADVGIEGDRIVAVGDVGSTDGAEVVELDGLVLAPGFVDIHTHYDAQVTWDGDLTPSCAVHDEARDAGRPRIVGRLARLPPRR